MIRGEHGLIKLGTSTNPAARLAQLRTASPFPLDFAYVCAVDGDAQSAALLEALTHDMLTKNRLNGEWFDIQPTMAVAAIAATAHQNGFRIVEVKPDDLNTVISLASVGEAGKPSKTAKVIAFIIKACTGLVAGLLLVIIMFVLKTLWTH